VVPFDIPIEAFAVEVGGGAHPAVRSLGDRRLVYVEHRLAVRRAYRRRQLFLAIGFSGAFVAVAAAALAPRGAVASAEPARSVKSVKSVPSVVSPRPSPPRSTGPVVPERHRPRRHQTPVASAAVDDRKLENKPAPYVLGYQGGPLARDPFLVCTRYHEAIYAGDYGAKSPGGQYRGAYQFDQTTWDHVALHLGRAELVGVDVATTPSWIQDLFAYTLYKWQGASHWNYRCDGLP
jgi:hypothetical protein